MGRFRVHVQHITYGWCGIELYINDKRIQYTASYMGSNPLAYLIGVCWEFCIAKRDGGIEGEEYLEECKDTWYSEPDSMKISLKLDRNDVVFLDIQARDGIDDDKCTVVEEWHESIPYEDFKEAIVAEGFRVLHAMGLYGYYTSWAGHEEFPLSLLLRLTGNIDLNNDGDSYWSELTKELECISNFTEEIKIKEETHYDECKLFYEAWQMQCCGDPFAVGDKVGWTCIEPREYKNAHGIILDFEEEHHGFATHSISGTVTQIIAERSEFPKGKRVVYYPQAKTIQEEISKADGREKDFPDDEETERTFWGYIVTLKDAVVKPLPEKTNNN